MSEIDRGLSPSESSGGIESRTIGPDALDDLFAATYDELHRLASAIQLSAPATSLTPTTLVNEAWIKLARSPRFSAVSVPHFKRIAGRAMRQVIVVAARRRNALKRGAGASALSLDGAENIAGTVVTESAELLALDEALDDLSKVSPRQAAVVEGRFFGGMEVAEVAEALGISEATALRDWRAAKAWLSTRLRS
jgi:RNA polymerase sigma factor (TIGR02999 family)